MLRPVHVALAAVSLIAGCSKGAEVNGAPSPQPPAPSNATAYIGSQSPGQWTLSVDDVQGAFSYQAQGAATATSGALRNTNGVLDFGNQGGTSLGKAVEQPSVGALLRPGGPATFPVAMVQQGDCLPLTGKTRYIYAALPGRVPQSGVAASSAGYGTFVASTSIDGKTWSFEDVHSYVVTNLQGGAFSADTQNGTDPALFGATCTSANSIGTVNADPKAAFLNGSDGTPAVPSFHFNAAGAFAEDRPTNQGGGWVGFVMPTVAIKASGVAAAGTYRGFFSESTDKIAVDTEPVSFAEATDGTTNLVGGAFPNDDLTQTPDANQYTITLGSQDSLYNGVFPNARFIAADPNGLCSAVALNDPSVKSSFDANGNIICTAAGVGVVSQINGKYVLYFTSHDGTKSTNNQSFLIQFYLYQE